MDSIAGLSAAAAKDQQQADLIRMLKNLQLLKRFRPEAVVTEFFTYARQAGSDICRDWSCFVQLGPTDIQQFRFTMRHIDGETNVLADHISRAEHVSEKEFAELQERLAARALPRDHRSPSPAPLRPQQPTAAAAPEPDPVDVDTDHSESSWVGSVVLDSGSEFSVAFASGGCPL